MVGVRGSGRGMVRLGLTLGLGTSESFIADCRQGILIRTAAGCRLRIHVLSRTPRAPRDRVRSVKWVARTHGEWGGS